MKRLAILGASGHGTVVADAALSAGWDDVALFDDAWPPPRPGDPWKVEGGTADLMRTASQYAGVVVAIGDNRTRLKKLHELASADMAIASIVHAAAVVSRFAQIGAGSVVCAGAVVSVHARIGLGCIVNTCASVDHDCVLADGVHVSPGARLGGGVSVGEATWIGIGASVRHGIAIGAGAMIGAGAAVVADVGDGQTVVGVPARMLPC